MIRGIRPTTLRVHVPKCRISPKGILQTNVQTVRCATAEDGEGKVEGGKEARCPASSPTLQGSPSMPGVVDCNHDCLASGAECSRLVA